MKRLLNETAMRCPNGRMPDTYLVFDTETSGTDPYRDAVMQYGFCVVEKRMKANRFAFIVKRPPDFIVAPGAFAVHHIDQARMQKEGIEPEVLIPEIANTLETYRKHGCLFVGHNMISFDAPFFERESKQHGCPFSFGPNEIIDTGMLVKASRLGMYFSPDDTIRSFARRVSEVRAKGIYWSLDRYCFDAFNLGGRSGIDKSAAHDASVDCELTHHLLEELRGRVEVSCAR